MNNDSSLQAVLFDLDGLLADTEPLHYRAFEVLLQRRGVVLPLSRMEHLLGFSVSRNIQDLTQWYNLTEDHAALFTEREQLYHHFITTEPVPALAGFWEISAEAARCGAKRAVVTSSERRVAEIVLEKVFAHAAMSSARPSFFDEVIYGDDAEHVKPAPDLYLLACERLGVVPERCLALEDTPVGVRAATTAGIPCLAVLSPFTQNVSFPGACAVVDSLYNAIPYLHNNQRMK